MDKGEIVTIMERLLLQIEEEDIGISLLTTHFQNKDELNFFQPVDRERVSAILKILSDDSKRHKQMLDKIVSHLGENYREK